MRANARLMIVLVTQKVSALRHPKSVRICTQRFYERMEAMVPSRSDTMRSISVPE
jgi:hypothetical protein